MRGGARDAGDRPGVTERVASLEKRVGELESVCRLYANVLRHLPPGEVERIVLRQIAQGFPLRGVNIPCGSPPL